MVLDCLKTLSIRLFLYALRHVAHFTYLLLRHLKIPVMLSMAIMLSR